MILSNTVIFRDVAQIGLYLQKSRKFEFCISRVYRRTKFTCCVDLDIHYSSGPSCSKLTMSLVNDSLNRVIHKYAEIFC